MQQCVERHGAREKALFYFLPLHIAERSVVNEHFGNRAVKKALDVRRLIRVVGVNTRADHYLIKSDHRFSALSLSAFEAVEKSFGAFLVDARTNGEYVEIAERPFTGIEETRYQQIAKTGRPGRLNVQHAEVFCLRRTEVEIQ